MTDYKLKATVRKLFGRKLKSLRRVGVIPANVFGKKTKSISIQLNNKELVATLRAAGETALINLEIEGEDKARPVLVSGYAQDPVTGTLLHVDFHQVDLSVKTTATVPLEVIGVAPATEAGNTLIVLRQDVDVEALPSDLPDKIEIDVTTLANVGDSILAKYLKFDRSKIELQIEEDEMIVTIQEPATEDEPEEEVEEATTEGEAAAEDKDKPEADAEAKAAEDK